MICLPGIETVRVLAAHAMLFGLSHGRFNRGSNILGNFILNRKDVDEIAVIAFSPYVRARSSLDELSRDTNPGSGLPHTALQHITRTKLPTNLFDIDVATLVGETRVSSDDKQPPCL